jgi:hypothetical protein
VGLVKRGMQRRKKWVLGFRERSPGKTCKLLGKERLKTVSQEVSDD